MRNKTRCLAEKINEDKIKRNEKLVKINEK